MTTDPKLNSNITYGRNTVSITNGLDANKDQSFGYDKLNRITAFNGAWGSGSFTYDVTGNRLTKTIDGVDTTYNYASNRLTGTTGNEPGSYAYNTAGHLTSGAWDGKNYNLTYDGFNQVSSFTSGGTLVAGAGYDGDGLRIKKITADGTTVYHFDPAGNVLSEGHPDGSKTNYIYLNGKLLAKVDVNAELAEEVFFYHTDFAGTPLAMSDASGQKIWEGDYKPFGEEFTVDGNGENDKRFVGKEKDEETGLNYFGARYLSAETGRFLAPDPVRAVGYLKGKISDSHLAEPQRLNTYAYAANNPLTFKDPNGLDFIYIIDNNAVASNGHAAAIVGPIKGKWFYNSFGPKGGDRAGQKTFRSEAEAMTFAKKHNYTSYAKWITDEKSSKEAQHEANKWMSGFYKTYKANKKYILLGGNCQKLVDAMADKAALSGYIAYYGGHPNKTFGMCKHGADEEHDIK